MYVCVCYSHLRVNSTEDEFNVGSCMHLCGIEQNCLVSTVSDLAFIKQWGNVTPRLEFPRPSLFFTLHHTKDEKAEEEEILYLDLRPYEIGLSLCGGPGSKTLLRGTNWQKFMFINSVQMLSGGLAKIFGL